MSSRLKLALLVLVVLVAVVAVAAVAAPDTLASAQPQEIAGWAWSEICPWHCIVTPP